jgi:hypothetical protein
LNVDDVLLEVRKVREAYAKRFGYDLPAIHRDLKEQEQASGRRIVSFPPRRPKPAMANEDSVRTSKGSGRTTAEADRGRVFGFARFNVLDPGSQAEPGNQTKSVLLSTWRDTITFQENRRVGG